MSDQLNSNSFQWAYFLLVITFLLFAIGAMLIIGAFGRRLYLRWSNQRRYGIIGLDGGLMYSALSTPETPDSQHLPRINRTESVESLLEVESAGIDSYERVILLGSVETNGSTQKCSSKRITNQVRFVEDTAERDHYLIWCVMYVMSDDYACWPYSISLNVPFLHCFFTHSCRQKEGRLCRVVGGRDCPSCLVLYCCQFALRVFQFVDSI